MLLRRNFIWLRHVSFRVFLLTYIDLIGGFDTCRLGTSLACNFLPFGADVTALCPKYCNIIRGQVCLAP